MERGSIQLVMLVMTRCITRSLSVPGATIRALPGDLEPLPARFSEAAPGAGPAADRGPAARRPRVPGWLARLVSPDGYPGESRPARLRPAHPR